MRSETTTGQTTARKRLLATGRKINGTWEIRTFMREAANGGRRPFWEALDSRAAAKRRR